MRGVDENDEVWYDPESGEHERNNYEGENNEPVAQGKRNEVNDGSQGISDRESSRVREREIATVLPVGPVMSRWDHAEGRTQYFRLMLILFKPLCTRFDRRETSAAAGVTTCKRRWADSVTIWGVSGDGIEKIE